MNAIQQLKRAIWSELADLHTNLPGTIIRYDATSGRAVVKPSLSKLLASGQELPAPPIVDVPLCWPSGDAYSALLAMPLKPGDSVTLKFSERAVDDWLENGSQVPNDPRMFDLCDAFATPTTDWRPINADPARVTLRYGATTIYLAKDGSLEVNAPAGTVWNGPGTLNGDWTHNGDLTRNGDLTGNGSISQSGGTFTHDGTSVGATHKHSGVESGNSNTGGPV